MKSMRPNQIIASKLSSIIVATFLSAFLLVPSEVAARAIATTYRNPLLEEMDMADPHVIKVGGKYYMYPTWNTKQYDVFISDDLVNWKHHGPVYSNDRRGLWAPEVFHNKRGDGKFYLYFTDNMPGTRGSYAEKQIGVAVANSPLGPFEDKAIFVKNSIDAHVFQDNDGKLYFYYVHLLDGFKIMAQEMADPVTLKGEAKEVMRPTEPWEKRNGEVTEGPFILKRKGIYYLTYSGTGADSPNYGIGYATSKSPMGPFVKYEGNPIVQRKGQLLGPGHHCVIEGPDKKLWMLYHQKRSEERSFKRYLAIDPIWFDKNGVLHAKATKGTDEPGPTRKSFAPLHNVTRR
ncbi:MAG: family 43 glycosylhydrolase [Verrucomicrobia bacterium]|nr:family 43 glycosylhydrolase [Verrucomicrobiota bacterium]